MSAASDQTDMLLRQIAEQGAVMIRELRTLSTKVEALAARVRPADVAEPKVRPYDWVPPECTCSAGWVLDEETNIAHRCPTCHPEGVPPANMS